jgi:16S rRNA (uracil1498-N3)-methyltransferase
MNIFYTPDITGDEYVLDENESKHCVRVLRQVKGDVLRLVDGKGGWYRAEITEADPRRCKVKVLEHVVDYEKRSFHLHVAIAPTKNNDRFEWFLEKATEIGIDEITPLICEHSERRNIKPERLNKVVVAAMKQSLKAYLPRLNNYTNFEAFIQNEHEGLKVIAHCDELHKTHLFHERSDFIDPDFGRLFEKPLEAIVVFGGRNGHVQMEGSLFIIYNMLEHLHLTTTGIGFGNFGTVPSALPVDQPQHIAFHLAQYPYTMLRFILIEHVFIAGNIGSIENIHCNNCSSQSIEPAHF